MAHVWLPCVTFNFCPNRHLAVHPIFFSMPHHLNFGVLTWYVTRWCLCTICMHWFATCPVCLLNLPEVCHGDPFQWGYTYLWVHNMTVHYLERLLICEHQGIVDACCTTRLFLTCKFLRGSLTSIRCFRTLNVNGLNLYGIKVITTVGKHVALLQNSFNKITSRWRSVEKIECWCNTDALLSRWTSETPEMQCVTV